MKVMCIDDRGHLNEDVIKAEIGSIYTVIDHETLDGELFYQLAEIPYSLIGERAFYISTQFSPLSEIDETELVEQRLITA